MITPQKKRKRCMLLRFEDPTEHPLHDITAASIRLILGQMELDLDRTYYLCYLYPNFISKAKDFAREQGYQNYFHDDYRHIFFQIFDDIFKECQNDYLERMGAN